MDNPSQHQQSLRDLATVKYAEVKALDHGLITGRRLELAMLNTPPEQIEASIIDQFVDIAQRLGSEFFAHTPAVALEQLVIMAITRNEDSAGLLKSLINSFMVAYMTPETSERAFQHLLGLEGLRAEVAKGRAPVVKDQPPTLKAYQVGDSDIVAAFDPAGAIKVLSDFNGEPLNEYALTEVALVSDALLDNRKGFNTDDGTIETLDQTLREQMAALTMPTYLYGWE